MGIGVADRPGVPAVPRPRGPMDGWRPRRPYGLRLSGRNHEGDQRLTWPLSGPPDPWRPSGPNGPWNPICPMDRTQQHLLFGSRSSAESRARYARGVRGLLALLKAAQAELLKKCRGEALLVGRASAFGCPIFPASLPAQGKKSTTPRIAINEPSALPAALSASQGHS